MITVPNVTTKLFVVSQNNQDKKQNVFVHSIDKENFVKKKVRYFLFIQNLNKISKNVSSFTYKADSAAGKDRFKSLIVHDHAKNLKEM